MWTDHAGAMRLAVVALHDLGHRVIAHVSGSPYASGTPWHVGRSAAFVEATAELGIAHSETQGDYSRQSGAEAIRSLLAVEQPPTAIIFDNDLMALGGLAQAGKSGRLVPDDLSIVAWDDSVRCQMTDPPLVAVSHDVRQIGQMIGDAITQARAGHLVRAETPPPTLVLRGSVRGPNVAERESAGCSDSGTPFSSSRAKHEDK
ncbi:LacI family DNA-binding transcriptional regulator [Arthrobacter globiformis]|uniref:LacI family DNA-binding transcriptional regulator n=1 Tax=Arthrobacter globiformis TaxID=1665 RepID=UPI00397C3343